MTREQLIEKFPRASADFIAANTSTRDSGKTSVMECGIGDESLEANQGKKRAATPVHIRFVSVRKRLCDPDNLCAKWTLDALRYCGAIAGDEPEKISLEVTQRKAGKGTQEHTVIEIYAASEKI